MNRCPVHPAHLMPFDAEYFADPYPTYERLHADGPVHRICTLDGSQLWLITGYDEVLQCLMDQRFARNRWYAGADYLGDSVLPATVRHGNVIMEDPPVHTRLRRLMNPAFLPSRLERLRGQIRCEVDALLDAMVEDAERAEGAEENGRSADLMAALAVPLTVTVVADILGVPRQARANFRKWGDAVFGGTPDRAQGALAGLFGMVSELVAARRAEPKDDFTSYLLTATDAEGRGLDEDEVLGMVYFIILGGFDSTAGTIGNTVLTLLQNPVLTKELQSNPDTIPRAIEELMRLTGALQTSIRRFATEDIELGDARIRAGDTVVPCLAAANRSPDKFPEPDTVDITRPRGDHLVFGKGAHICPGADLARIEMSTAVDALLRRFPDLALAVPPEQIVWRPSHVVRAPVKLPVTF
jgi:cytochrome P450